MRNYSKTIKKERYKTFPLTAGHCDLCKFKCPHRDQPPCKRKGIPSMEAIGIDVYKLLNFLEVDYEYPVINELTNVTMILVRR